MSGCETVQRLSTTEYIVVIIVGFGPIAARVTGRITVSDAHPPDSYQLHFELLDAMPGFNHGHAVVRLEPDGDGTLLRYTLDVQAGGLLAPIGSQLLESQARKQSHAFFERFRDIVRTSSNAMSPTPMTLPMK